MLERPTIPRERSAVLIMDYQTGIVNGYATDQEALLARAAAVLRAARGAGIPIIYIVVGFRPGYPEVSPRNAGFSAIRQSARFQPGDPDTEIHPAVAPLPGDITVVKHRVGAFLGTDLDMILRARDIDTLILFGIATSGVVLSTVRYAADADYRLVLVGDACADRDEEVHRVLVEKVLARQATVVTADAFVRALAGGG